MRTIKFKNAPSIIGSGNIVGSKEGEGPLGKCFDRVVSDPMFGEKNWEAAESKFLRGAVRLALKSANLERCEVMFSGDLQNQCTSTYFSARELDIPMFGIYGACSTFSEGLTLAAMAVSGGFFKTAAAAASSHFCSAEKQFRTPLEYGGQRPPTAQWTVTGAASVILGMSDTPPYVTSATVGRIRDRGVTDPNNMGAAMAPAFADTIITHFKETNTTPSDYDLILSGDLGRVGGGIATELIKNAGYDISEKYNDCGNMIFSEDQDVHAGGSGCACSGAVVTGHILKEIKNGTLGNVLFAATGAMLNRSSTLRGESIPGISYAVTVSGQKSFGCGQ